MTSCVGDDSSVKVAIRIRPQLAREQLECSRVCTSVTPGEPQVTLGKDKDFTYDYVFDFHQTQEEIYSGSVTKLVDGCFDGYNATVIAYGQTGAGKTHTMGTGFEMDIVPAKEGMIPRALRQIFDGIEKRRQEAESANIMRPEFTVSVQFMEIYNEEINDLLNTSGQQRKIRIHEDEHRNIVAEGLEEARTESFEDTMRHLQAGALNRTTASTKMNTQSSRSHAVFTLNISQTRSVKTSENETEEVAGPTKEVETVCSKFHFVDLAGSERLKRTGATGARAKEGISINCGLLALGNVISALGDRSKKGSHVPYRDSKITRLLQDSLGGNSRTIMIACISPSDSDFMETLNTLKYANRARNIKNKVSQNQDSTSKQLALLRDQLHRALAELAMYKSGAAVPNGNSTDGFQVNGAGDGDVNSFNDMFQENNMLQDEIKKLKSRINDLQATVDSQKDRLVNLQMNNINPSDQETNELIQNQLNQIEELSNRLAQAEARAARPRIGSAKESFLSSSVLLEKTRQALHTQNESLTMSMTHISDYDPDQNELEDIENQIEENEELKNLDKKVAQRKDDISAISDQIALNEELVIQLETTMANLESEMKHQKQMYENKLKVLEEKIRQAELDRDQALKLSQNKNDSANPKVKEMSEKIKNYKNELKTLQMQKKEHEKAKQEKAKSEQNKQRQLALAKESVEKLKKQKVEMVKKMKEETKLAHEKEKEARKEIIQMKKLQRASESLAQKNATKIERAEEQLRKKALEITNLKSKLKEEKDKKSAKFVSGNIRPRDRVGSASDAKHTRKIWKDVRCKLENAILTKETTQSLEFELDRLLKERQAAESDGADSDHLDYLNQRIEEAQTELCDLVDDELIINPAEFGKNDLIQLIGHLLPHYINSQSQANIEKRQLTKNLQKVRFEKDQQEKEYMYQKNILGHLINPNQSKTNMNPMTPSSKQGKKKRSTMMLGSMLGTANDESPQITKVSHNSSTSSSPRNSSPASTPRSSTTSLTTPRSSNGSKSSFANGTKNVWNRLTGNSSANDTKSPGRFMPYFSAEDHGVENMECQSVMIGHRKKIIELFASDDGSYLFSSSKDKLLKIWNLKTEKEIGEINLSAPATVIEYDNDLLYFAEGNKVHIYVVSISLEKSLKTIQEMKSVNAIKVDSKKHLYTVQDKVIKCYKDFESNCFKVNSNSEITSFSVKSSSSSATAVFGCRDHCIYHFKHDFDKNVNTELMKFDHPHLDTVTSIIHLNDHIYSVSRDKSIIQWDLNGSKLKQTSNLHGDWIVNLQVFNNHIITNSRDGSVKVWDPETMKLSASINQFKDPDGICSITANSTNLFTGAQTKNIKIWKILNV